jgi:hypothetical protein
MSGRSDLTPTESDLLGAIICHVPAWAGMKDDGWVAGQARLFIRSLAHRAVISERLMNLSIEGYGRALRGLESKGVMVKRGRGQYALAEFYWPGRWNGEYERAFTAAVADLNAGALHAPEYYLSTVPTAAHEEFTQRLAALIVARGPRDDEPTSEAFEAALAAVAAVAPARCAVCAGRGWVLGPSLADDDQQPCPRCTDEGLIG